MISIVVCTYNREKYLGQMLNSVASQSCAKNDFELVVINNKSTDSTAIICKEFEMKNQALHYQYYLEDQQGLAYARNRGIKEAKGEVIIFIDDDAFLDENYIKELKFSLTHLPILLGFGGKIEPFLECELPNWMSKYLSPLMSVIDLGNEIRLFKGSKYPIGANMGVSRKVVEQVGIFNENLGRKGKSMLGGEEKDFFLRIKEANIPIYYIPKALVHHVIPEDRLKIEFINKQALNIGISERLRTKSSKKYVVRTLSEIYKWGGTLILFVFFSLKRQMSKGLMLIRFRWWVSRGLWGS